MDAICEKHANWVGIASCSQCTIESLRQQLAAVTKERDQYSIRKDQIQRDFADFRATAVENYSVKVVPFQERIMELQEQLAAALAACEAKDAALVDIKIGLDIDEYEWGVAGNALAIQPDAFALKAHDDALIERCAEVCEEYQGGAETCSAAIRKLKGP